MRRPRPSINLKRKRGRPAPIIGYYRYWVVLTYLSAVSAVVGMYFALSGHVGIAVFCLMVCGLCDMLDGPAARRKERNEREKSYGVQIDSLTDLVSFGVFPVVIGYSLGAINLNFDEGPVSSGMVISTGIAAIYVLAALIRLAYFNVIEIELQGKREIRKYYEGLPVTSVAILIPLVYSICLIFDVLLSLVYPAMLFFIAVAFVARVRIPKIRGRYLVIFLIIGLPIAIFLIWNIGVSK